MEKAASAPMSETGTVKAGIRVALQSWRKIKTQVEIAPAPLAGDLGETEVQYRPGQASEDAAKTGVAGVGAAGRCQIGCGRPQQRPEDSRGENALQQPQGAPRLQADPRGPPEDQDEPREQRARHHRSERVDAHRPDLEWPHLEIRDHVTVIAQFSNPPLASRN